MGKFHILIRGIWELILGGGCLVLLTRFPKQAFVEWRVTLLFVLLALCVPGCTILALEDFNLAKQLWGEENG